MKPTNQRFFNDVVIAHDSDECLPWPFSTTLKGYPHMYHDGRWVLVTRRICERVYGPPPSRRHHAAHSCNNVICVNQRHVSWKTPKENEQDKIANGTYQYGERNPRAKLTREQALAIFSAAGSHREIAEQYGVGREAVGKIKRRERWTFA